MGIFSFFKNLFIGSETINEEVQNDYEDQQDIKLDKVIKTSDFREINEGFKSLKRLKYKESRMNLSTPMECEILRYLLDKESSDFNVYWNLYIPYGDGSKYMQVDFIVLTGEIAYILEAKEYRHCTCIEEREDRWKCYYGGKVYDNLSGIEQNRKHIEVLKKFLKTNRLEFKSVLPLIVSDNFNSDINYDELILVRESEENILYKLLDRRVRASKCEDCIDNEFLEINKKLYTCMNVSDDIVNSHKEYIKQRY